MNTTRRPGARILAFALTACLAATALAFGGTEPLAWPAVQLAVFLLFGFLLWARGTRVHRRRLPWQPAALLLGYVSLQTAVIRPDAYLLRQQVFRLLACLCVFYLTLYVAGSERPRTAFLRGLLALGLFEALYGLAQYLTGWQQIFAYKKVFYLSQATGTYINPNHFAGLLEMILPLSFASALDWLERLRKEPGIAQRRGIRLLESEGIAPLAFFFFSTLLLSAGILFSRSRAGILSAGIAVIAMGILWIATSAQRTTAALVVVAVLAGAALLGLWIGLGPVLERYQTIPGDSLTRVEAWKDTLALIQAHPFWGTGPGTFINAYTGVQTALLGGVVDHAHNDYLEFAAEWGIPGAALLMGLIFWLLARTVSACFRSERPCQRMLALGTAGSILALLLHSLADFNLQIPANALVFSAILGLAHSASSVPTHEDPTPAAATQQHK